MKFLMLLLAPLWASLAASGELGFESPRYLRVTLERAAFDSDAADRFYQTRKETPAGGAPIAVGYAAMSHLVKAKHAVNPASKLGYFSSGRKLLEASIERSRSSVELRYLRHSVQNNAPWFLGYSDNLSEDAKVLNRYVTAKPRRDRDLYRRISKYLKEEG
jgi:hypothetical protein